MLMGRGLSLSPTVLFVGFIFWAWLLGGPGAFLAVPLTIFAVLMLETFPETRWLAAVMGMSAPDSDDPTPEEDEVESSGLTPMPESLARRLMSTPCAVWRKRKPESSTLENSPYEPSSSSTPCQPTPPRWPHAFSSGSSRACSSW